MAALTGMPSTSESGEIVLVAFRVHERGELSPEDEAIARLEANAASANTRIKRR